jgi:hypothetical protein
MPENTSVNYEDPFWLQILGDHMRFILIALPARETEHAQQAEHYITLFDTLFAQSKEYLPEIAQERFLDTTYNSVQQARMFVLSLLRRQLMGDYVINIAPGFLNQMANETEEYLRILDHAIKGTDSLMHPIHYHLLWLLNCSLSADNINACLDPVERDLLRGCHRFMHKFDNLYLKSIELMGFLRSGLPEFPSLNRLNSDVVDELAAFAAFMLELEDKVVSKEILGTLCRLQVNHIYRKSCYYACKLSEICDLGSTGFDLSQKRRD